MRDWYTLSALARAAGLPPSTVRYYERIGLLQPEARSRGNYRLYTEDSLRRLRFIRAAHGTGFTLEDVKQLLGSARGTPPSCREVQRLIEKRLEEIEKRLRELRHVQQVLEAALRKCKRTDRNQCCHVLETLRSSSSR
jgi:DNA-binding transcriptional MerR regulator